jgi:guanylate kinase
MSSSAKRRGALFVVSAPSGGGKTTLVKAALAADPTLRLSISCTTRAPRADEVDGVDYFFVGREEFERRRAAGEFVEWAEIFSNLYATPRAPLERALAEGRDLILDVDVLGMGAIKRAFGDDAVGIFVIPPSVDELERRLRTRGSDDEAALARRLGRAEYEMKEARQRQPPIYDHWLVNDEPERAAAELRKIIAQEQRKRSPLPSLG